MKLPEQIAVAESLVDALTSWKENVPRNLRPVPITETEQPMSVEPRRNKIVLEGYPPIQGSLVGASHFHQNPH